MELSSDYKIFEVSEWVTAPGKWNDGKHEMVITYPDRDYDDRDEMAREIRRHPVVINDSVYDVVGVESWAIAGPYKRSRGIGLIVLKKEL